MDRRRPLHFTVRADMNRRSLWFYLAMLLAAPLIVLIEIWPFHPHTRSGWLMLLALSAPLCLAGAALERLITNNPVAAKIDARTSHETISGLRMLYALAVIAVIAILGLAGQTAWHHWVE